MLRHKIVDKNGGLWHLDSNVGETEREQEPWLVHLEEGAVPQRRSG